MHADSRRAVALGHVIAGLVADIAQHRRHVMHRDAPAPRREQPGGATLALIRAALLLAREVDEQRAEVRLGAICRQ